MHANEAFGTKPNSGIPVSSERALGALWRRVHTLSDGLITEDGKRFRVRYPGRASARSGPDFLDAVIINEDGESITGDVELHLNEPDWYNHHHDVDPNYNEVVLHIVLRAKGRVRSWQQSGVGVPVASIADVSTQLGQAGDSQHPAFTQLLGADETDLERSLDRAGDERFIAKSRGFAIELSGASALPEQCFYRTMMESLGYASNRKPFRTLADRVPVRLI